MCARLARLVTTVLWTSFAAALFLSSQALAQKVATPSATWRAPEERTARAFEAARANPLELHAFLVRMPKGADLHNHLSGAVYAESWIRAGAKDNLCVDLATLSFFKTEAMTKSIPPKPVCGEGKTPGEQALANQSLYDALIDSFSMRGFVPAPGVTAHDHFFATFAKFGGTDHRHLGEWLDEVATRAAAQNEQYLELMHTPNFNHAASIAKELGWHDDLAQFRDALLAHGLRDDIAVDRKEIRRCRSVAQRARTLRSAGCDSCVRGTRSALSIRSCAASPRSKFSRRRCSASKSPQPIPA